MKGTNIILIGMMGCGKSTIGQALSYEIGWDFVDLDESIEKQIGTTIREIFETKGEDYFRELETRTLKDFCGKYTVVATGGGIVERAENIEILKSMGTVFYLSAPIEDLFERIKKETKRPLLKGKTHFENLFQGRKDKYEKAHFEIDTHKKRVPDIVEEIYEKLNG